MKKRALMLISIVASPLCATMSNLNIAFVNASQVMQESTGGKKLINDIEKLRNEYLQEIQKEAQKVEKERNDLKAKASTLKPEAFAKEERRIQKMERDFNDLKREKEESIQLIWQQKAEELANEIEQSIVSVAKEKNFDAVIDKSGRVMYSKDDDKGDITKDVTAFLDQKSSTALAAKNQKSSLA